MQQLLCGPFQGPPGWQNFLLIDSFPSLYDTLYTDTLHLLNTLDGPFSYKVEFINDSPGNRFLVGTSQTASSVYLTVTPSDNRNNLSWEEHVPWTNTRYVVYRQNAALLFDSIAGVAGTFYSDTNLANGVEYCYMIKSVGGYTGGGFIDPIENFSEEKCGTPIDNVPPCSPLLSLSANCDVQEITLIWTNPNNSCADDVLQYEIYFYAAGSDIGVLLATYTSANDTTYVHANLNVTVGCYQVIALDSAGNRSYDPITVCIDTCHAYSLPNIFTPDDDGNNDLFHPCDQTTGIEFQKLCPPYRNIRDVDMKIYNRWGQLVFKTTDLNILWNGKINNSGGDCPDGVYFYICEVNEIHIDGIRKRTLNGFTHLIRKP